MRVGYLSAFSVVVGAVVAVTIGAVRNGVTAQGAVGPVSVRVCRLRLPPPLRGEPGFVVPAGGRAIVRSIADRIVLCTLLRADGSTFAQARIDREEQVLDMRFVRTSGRLLFDIDAALPAIAGTQGAKVDCGSAASDSIGRGYWRRPFQWWLGGKTPSSLPRADVVRALRAAQSEWINNINWCHYPDNADGFAVYEGTTSVHLAHDGINVVDWGDLRNLQGCASAIACTMSWYATDGAPVESDVRFSDRVRWSVHPRADAYDIQSLAAHEFGHVRQFGHVTSERLKQYTLIMWPYFSRGDTSARELGRGDSLEDNNHY
jgi:hypothetical protein